MKPEATDGELVCQARQGETAAFDGLVERHFDAVYAVALSRLRDPEPAQDLAQEVFLRAWLNIGKLKDGHKFAPWICRICRNLSVNWIRDGVRRSKLVRMVPMSDQIHDNIPAAAPDPAQAAEKSDHDQRLQAALLKLDADEREIVMMHFMEQVSQRELAGRLGIHHATVGRRLEKSLGKLREMLGEEVRPHSVPQAPLVARTATMSLIAATATMPLDAKAALVAAADATSVKSGVAEIMIVLPELLQTTSASFVAGVQVMSVAQKVAAAVATVAVLVGGTYVYHAQVGGGVGLSLKKAAIAAPEFDREISYGLEPAETVLDIATGETVRVHLDETLFDAFHLDLTARTDGMLRVVSHTVQGVFTETVPPSSSDPSEPAFLTNIQIWEERDRVFIKSICIEKTETGLRLHLFAKNRPELLVPLKNAERAYAEGRISRRQLKVFAQKVFSDNGMYPGHPGNRMHVETVFREEIYQ